VGVGGTALSINTSTGAYAGEAGWGGSGGGVSGYLSKPAYQSGLSYARRSSPDVAYNADPRTGVYVRDTSSGGGWYQVGGTSAGAPQWAALVAIADQGRELAGRSSLDGAGNLLPALYKTLASTSYHDITTGSAGRNRARAGYDLVTGLGSPKADLVVQALVSAVA
jgi:subtilase family serine protease